MHSQQSANAGTMPIIIVSIVVIGIIGAYTEAVAFMIKEFYEKCITCSLKSFIL